MDQEVSSASAPNLKSQPVKSSKNLVRRVTGEGTSYPSMVVDVDDDIEGKHLLLHRNILSTLLLRQNLSTQMRTLPVPRKLNKRKPRKGNNLKKKPMELNEKNLPLLLPRKLRLSRKVSSLKAAALAAVFGQQTSTSWRGPSSKKQSQYIVLRLVVSTLFRNVLMTVIQ